MTLSDLERRGAQGQNFLADLHNYVRAMCMLELLMLKRDILFVPGGDFSARDIDAVIHSLCNDWC